MRGARVVWEGLRGWGVKSKILICMYISRTELQIKDIASFTT